LLFVRPRSDVGGGVQDVGHGDARVPAVEVPEQLFVRDVPQNPRGRLRELPFQLAGESEGGHEEYGAGGEDSG